MTIPQPPKSKKEIEFPDIDEREQKETLYKEIWQTLMELREVLPNPKGKDLILRFAEHINGGDLPYVCNRPTAKRAKKSACLFSLISWVIQEYWKCCKGERTQEAIEFFDVLYLTKIREITANGINAYKVVGNPVDGYSLEKK